MVPRFQEITPRVTVTDLSRTVQFYRDVLGFVVDLAWPEKEPTFVVLQRDDVQLGFYLPDEYHSAKTIGGCDFYIEVEDVVGLHAALQGSVSIEWGPEVYFYGRREFAVRDPDGYLLIFTEPTDDSPTCPDE